MMIVPLFVMPPPVGAAFRDTEVEPCSRTVPRRLTMPPPKSVFPPLVILRSVSTTAPALTNSTVPVWFPSNVGVGKRAVGQPRIARSLSMA
jgi:hypothetical protein